MTRDFCIGSKTITSSATTLQSSCNAATRATHRGPNPSQQFTFLYDRDACPLGRGDLNTLFHVITFVCETATKYGNDKSKYIFDVSERGTILIVARAHSVPRRFVATWTMPPPPPRVVNHAHSDTQRQSYRVVRPEQGQFRRRISGVGNQQH